VAEDYLHIMRLRAQLVKQTTAINDLGNFNFARSKPNLSPIVKMQNVKILVKIYHKGIGHLSLDFLKIPNFVLNQISCAGLINYNMHSNFAAIVCKDLILNDPVYNLFTVRFNAPYKTMPMQTYQSSVMFILKQKRYSRQYDIVYSGHSGSNVNIPVLHQFNYKQFFFTNSTLYNLVQQVKTHTEQTPASLNSRLYKTKKLLVVPAHTNITVITNSYDIIHS